MTINAAPNADYEAWCDAQPSGHEWHGAYVETLMLSEHGGFRVFSHGLSLAGGHTRYRGEFDFYGYETCVLDMRGVDLSDEGLNQAALYMTH